MRTLSLSVQRLSGHKKTLLPVIHKLWISITTCVKPQREASIRPLTSSTSQPNDTLPHTLLAIEVCDLISVIADISGDFFSFKFDDDLFPLLSILIQTLARTRMGLIQAQMEALSQSMAHRSSPPNIYTSTHSSTLSQTATHTPYESHTDRRLRLSILTCLMRLVNLPQCASYLTPAAPAIARDLLPFLVSIPTSSHQASRSHDTVNESDEVVNLAQLVYKSLLKLDTPGVWHLLWKELHAAHCRLVTYSFMSPRPPEQIASPPFRGLPTSPLYKLTCPVSDSKSSIHPTLQVRNRPCQYWP